MAGIDSNTSYGSSGEVNFNAAYKAVKNAINTQYSQLKNPAKAPQPTQVAPPTSWKPPIPQAGGSWQPTAAPQVNWAPGQQPIGQIPYMVPEVDPNQPQYQKPQVWKNMETGEEVTSSVPPDYKTYTASSGLGVAGSSPENLKFRNMPSNFPGGGQYVVDTQQPGKIIRSDRGEAPWNYNKNPDRAGVYSSPNTAFQHQTMLGNIPSLPSTGKRAGFGMQVDHIVPLALGGADTPQNKELLGPTDNANKTKIQAVAMKLLENKVINENQARIMAMTWRDKNPDYVTNTDEYGFVPTLNDAKRIADQWKKDQETPHPKSGKGILGWVGDTWNEMKNLKDFGQETLGSGVTGATMREFAKGTTSGFTMGYVPYEEDDDYKSTAAKAAGAFAGLAGNVFGQFASYALGVKALGMIGAGLGKIGVISRALETGIPGAKAIQSGLEVAKTTDETVKAFNSSIAATKYLKSIGAFTLYGQLAKGGIVNSMVTGEDTPWGSRFLQDMVMGGTLSYFNNPGVKNAVKTIGWVTAEDMAAQALNMMNGYGDFDIRRSITNGLTIGALHYAGTMNSPALVHGEAKLGADIAKNEWATAKAAGDYLSGGLNTKAMEKGAQERIDEFLKRIDTKAKEDAETKKIYYQQGPEAVVRFYQARALALHDQFIRQLPEDQQLAMRAQDAVSLIKWQAENKPMDETLGEVIQPAIDQMIKGGAISSKPEYTYQSPVVPGQYRFSLSGTNNKEAPWLNTNAKNYLSALSGENPNKVALTEGYVVFDKQLGNVTKRFSGDPSQTENYGRVFFPVVDKTTGFTQMLEVGTLPREASLVRYNNQNAERIAKNPDSKIKLPDFDTTHNVDNIAARAQSAATEVVPLKLEYGQAGGELVAKNVATENTTSITARIEPDAFERGKAISDELNKVKSSANDGNSGVDQVALQQSGAPVDVMNSLVSSFKQAMSTKPEEFAKNVNDMWGPGTLTADQAKLILGNPNYSIGDMLAMLKKNSPVWRQTNIFDSMVGDTGLVAKTGPAWNSYKKIPVSKFNAIPEQGSTIDLSGRNRPSEATATTPTAKVTPERPTTATGNIPINVKGTYPAFITPKASTPVAAEVAKSTEGAVRAAKNVKEGGKKNKTKMLMQKASAQPTPVEQERLVELKIASKGVNPEVKKALVAEGVPAEMVEKAAKAVEQESRVVKPTPQNRVEIGEGTASQGNIPAPVQKQLDVDTIKRDSFPVSESRESKTTHSLWDRAFNDKYNYFGHGPSDTNAIKIMRAVGEENLVVDPKTGVISIKPTGSDKKPITGAQIREKAGMSNLEFIDGIDRMSQDFRPNSAGKIAESPVMGKKLKLTEEPSKYTTDDSALWIAKNAKSAAEKIKAKQELTYEEGLATGFMESLKKIVGPKATPDNLQNVFGIGQFMRKIMSEGKPMKSSTTGEDTTQPLDLLQSRVQQERGRIGEMPKDTRSKLFQKRLDEEALARQNKELADASQVKKSPDEETAQERKMSAMEDDVENPELDQSTGYETGTFGMTHETESQSMKRNIPISQLEYSLPGFALRNAGVKVNATDGVKDGLLLARRFLQTYNKYSKYKQHIDFAEMEKSVRPMVDPDFAKIVPLMERKELKRVTKEIIKKTEPQVDSSPLVENPYIVPPSPRINVKEMIQKYDGQNPAGSTKIMETILKSKGYVKQDNKYGNIWTNKKYERILKATKKVKDAPKQDGKGGPGWLDSLADKVIPARTVKFDRDAMPQQDAVMENTAAPILNNPQPEQTNTSSPGMFSKLLDTVNPSRTAKFDRSLLPPETQAVPVQPPKVAPTPTPAPAPAPAPAPQKSGFSLPKITLPKMPKMTMPEMPSAPQMPDLPKMPQMPELPKVSELFGGGTYNVRGIKVNDNDIEEAAKILYAEISNRSPEKQAFEIRHIINTALNRSLNPGLDKGKSLTQVLQRRAQYQGYAPNGMTVKGGKVVKSQYQLVSEGKLRPDQQKKYEHIKNILNELKNGNFEDTTGGAQFYVHASDGTLWLGQTINEAKNNANKHEKAVKSQTTKWGTAVGMPAEIAKI